MSMEAPECSGEYIIQFLKVRNREKETPVRKLHFLWPFLSSLDSVLPFIKSLNRRHLLGGAEWARLRLLREGDVEGRTKNAFESPNYLI